VLRLYSLVSSLRWSELRDAVGGQDRVNSEMPWEAVIEQDWRCTLRP